MSFSDKKTVAQHRPCVFVLHLPCSNPHPETLSLSTWPLIRSLPRAGSRLHSPTKSPLAPTWGWLVLTGVGVGVDTMRATDSRDILKMDMRLYVWGLRYGPFLIWNPCPFGLLPVEALPVAHMIDLAPNPMLWRWSDPERRQTRPTQWELWHPGATDRRVT